MNIKKFKEFEAYAQAVVHANLHLMLPRLIEPRWEVATQTIGDINIQFGKEACGIIAEGAVHPGMKTLFVPIAGSQLANGLPLHNHSVLELDPGAELTIASQEAHDWCSIQMPAGVFNHDTDDDADPNLSRAGSQVINIGNEAMTRLRRLLVQLDHSLRIEPNLTMPPATQKSIQADILAACRLITAEKAAPRRTMGRPSLPRGEIIRRSVEEIERHENEFLSMEDLTHVANVSERTLRNVFLEYFGIPPRRFLTIQRLHRVRTTLQKADPDCEKVSAVACQFGFWHFGRFASEYCRLFGEQPSHTLKRQPARCRISPTSKS